MMRCEGTRQTQEDTIRYSAAMLNAIRATLGLLLSSAAQAAILTGSGLASSGRASTVTMAVTTVDLYKAFDQVNRELAYVALAVAGWLSSWSLANGREIRFDEVFVETSLGHLDSNLFDPKVVELKLAGRRRDLL